MWLPDGRQWLSASDVLPPAGSPATGNTNAQPALKPSDSSPSPTSAQPGKSLRSAVLWLRKMRAIGERKTPDAALKLRRASLIALCPLILATCSPAKPWQRDPVPAVTPCPIVQCLDRALQTCEGVEPPSEGVRNCQDAVLLASDALGEVMVCQEAHRLLIECVNRFNEANGR